MWDWSQLIPLVGCVVGDVSHTVFALYEETEYHLLNLSVKQECEVQFGAAVSETCPVVGLSRLVYSRCDDEGCVGEVG